MPYGTTFDTGTASNATPLFGRPVNVLKPILRQSQLFLSVRSDRAAAE